MSLKEFSFTVPTTNSDGSPITSALSYTIYADTVNPPVKAYTVPGSVTPVAGVLTATFAQIGFVPVNGTAYFAGATATDSSGTSPLSNIASFTYTVVPSAPTNFTVA